MFSNKSSYTHQNESSTNNIEIPHLENNKETQRLFRDFDLTFTPTGSNTLLVLLYILVRCTWTLLNFDSSQVVRQGARLCRGALITYSTTKMADKRATSLCMLYDVQFTPGHQLKHRRSQLLVMEMDDEEPMDEEIELIEENRSVNVVSTQFNAPQLSLNVPTRVHNYQTIWISGFYNYKY
ncbi:hypothetical protein CR513_39941, partial [Mucuna pruriens]